MSDTWLQNCESCEKYAQEIFQKINEMKQLPTGPSKSRLSSTIRTMMTAFGKDVDKLSRDLTTHSRNKNITEREANRRRTLVDAIKQSHKEIDISMKESYGGQRPRETSDPRFVAGVETEHTPSMSNEDVEGLRASLKRQNDDAIEALHVIVKRQQEIGRAMNSEVDRHNEIIEDVTDKSSLLDARVKRQTLLVKTIHRKSGAAWLWLIVLLLFVAIVVIAAVPFG